MKPSHFPPFLYAIHSVPFISTNCTKVFIENRKPPCQNPNNGSLFTVGVSPIVLRTSKHLFHWLIQPVILAQDQANRLASKTKHKLSFSRLVSPPVDQSAISQSVNQPVSNAAHQSATMAAMDHKPGKDWQLYENLDFIQTWLWSFLLIAKKRPRRILG